MQKKLPRSYDVDSALAERIGGVFDVWCERNPARRSTGVVIVRGRRMFDWRVAREQVRSDFARWQRSLAAPRVKQPTSRTYDFTSRAGRARAARPSRAVSPSRSSDDPEPEPARREAAIEVAP